MNAGLPGTGIGGLFYIVGALWMPVDAVYRRFRHRERGPGWRSVAVQSGIALGILAALWVTGWSVGYLATLAAATDPGSGDRVSALMAPSERVVSVVRWVAVLGSVGVLMVVLAAVQLLRLVIVRPRREDDPPGVGDEEEGASSPASRGGSSNGPMCGAA